MNAGLRRTVWWVCALVVLRLAYFGQYLLLPFVFGPLFDSHVYLEQADAVQSGRFGDPTLLAFSPLYGYFLALFGSQAGDMLPFAVQLALGVANVFLVARISAHLFGREAAPYAALAWALYGPILLFESKIMSETLGLGLLLLGMERFTSSEFAQGRTRTIVATALALTCAVWARASLLFCLPLFVLSAPLRVAEGEDDWSRPALRRALGLGLVIAALLGAYGSFTRAASGLFVPVIMVSNTVAQTTGHAWSGDLDRLRAEQEPRVGAYSVVDQAATRLSAIRRGEPDPADRRAALSGIDVLGFVRQVPMKLALTLRDLETSFDYGFYGERSEVPVLYLTFVTFGMLACTAAIGMWLAIREGRWRSLVPLAPILLGVLLTTTLFHPSTRYRLPLVVVWAPLSGLAWARAVADFRQDRRTLIAVLGLIAVGFLIRGTTRGLDHPARWHLRVAESAAMANDLPECRARVRAALQAEPNSDAARRPPPAVLRACYPPASSAQRPRVAH